VADILCEHKASTKLVQAFATYFARQNPRFDVQRFATATRACRI